MKDFPDIPDEIRDIVLNANSLAVWPIDQSPMHASYQIARFFQDEEWGIFPIHETIDRILEAPCYRDIRLIPDDYDILLLFHNIDRMPEVINAIFNADYIPPLVWAHEGLIDLESIDRLNDGGVPNVMDADLRDYFEYLRNMEG